MESNMILITKKLEGLLSSKVNFDQNDAITVYNAVYSICNTPSEDFQIFGQEVYDLLYNKFRRKCESLKFGGTVESLKVDYFEKVILYITISFGYLNKFFVKFSDCIAIEEMLYRTIYNSYFSKIGIQQFLVFNLNTESIPTIKFYLKTTRNAGKSDIYREFVNLYISEYAKRIDIEQPLKELIRKVYQEIGQAQCIFNDKKISSRLAKLLLYKSNDLILLLVNQILRNSSSYKTTRKILRLMDSSIQTKFQGVFKESLINELRKDFINTFHKVSLIMENECVDCSTFVFAEKSSKEQEDIIEYSLGEYDLIATKQIEEVDEMQIHKLRLLFKSISCDYFNARFIEYCQERLLKGFRNDLLLHQYFKDLDFSVKYKHSIDNITPVHLSDTPFDVFVYKLTKGLWNFEENKYKIHPELETKEQLLKELEGNLYRANINHPLSFVILNVNGFNVKLGVQHATVLLNISEGNFNNDEVLCEFLMKNFLISEDFKSILPITQHLDLFEVNYLKKSSNKLLIEENHYKKAAKIVSFLKKAKESDVESLQNKFGEVYDALSYLSRQGYVEIGEVIRYIP